MKRRAGLHLPSIRGRAWADRGPLVLTGTVVALSTLLASAVPVLMPRIGSEAVREAVTRAGERGALVVIAPFEPAPVTMTGRARPSEVMGHALDSAEIVLGDDLAAISRPPVATVTSATLDVTGFGPGRFLQLGYVANEAGEPAITWTQGGPPKSTVPKNDSDPAVLGRGELWPVQVGLSEATAAQLKIGPGQRISAEDRNNNAVDLRVSGVFRVSDPNDPTWRGAPNLLRPDVGFDGTGTRSELTALLTADSLPDARLALAENDMQRTITFVPEPQRLTWETSKALAATVAQRKAALNPIEIGWEANYRFSSGLDRVLNEVRAEGAAAAQQASVLLVGLVATAALILLLATDLLVRRRALVLAGTRMRGASLVGIGAEILVESIAVTLAGVGLGLLAGLLLVGESSWAWQVPVILVAVLGGPVLSAREAARATLGRQAPANHSARQTLVRTGQLRRAALEITVVLAAAGAFAALRQRGVVSASPDDSGDLLPALAPTLGAITGALIGLRLLPALLRLALRRAVRHRGSLPLFAAARAAAAATRTLPLVVLVLSSALLTFSLALAATARDGQDEGAWRSVGADARLNVSASASVPALAQRIAAEDGVRQVVSAHVTDTVTVSSNTSSTTVRLVAVDPASFEHLLADSPLPDGPQLSRLRATGGGPLPALLRTTDSRFSSGSSLTLAWNGAVVPLTDVGVAPAIGDGEDGVLIVDALTYASAMAKQNITVDPNTVWVLGPRAHTAITDAVGAQGQVTSRDEVLTANRQAPLAAGIVRLALASATVLLLFGLLSVILAAAAGAPARTEMLARLRTLGLRPRQARQVALGELLPTVIVGALGGLLIGILLAHASLGRLALRLITGQAGDPDLVVPWVSLVPVVLLGLAVVVVIALESSLRRRERLGQVLRAGSQ